jgi:4-amino-4-deoxy-L-arabinose transferase-like glycosyltransferase
MSSRSTHPDTIFWLVAIALLFGLLGSTTMWQSEDRWLEVAREMLLSGKYFHPTVNNVLYFDKPLFSYWLVAGVSSISGLNEWALRIPSALAALIALWATRDLAKQLWNVQTARYAGWILLTSFGFLQWGRLGEADMENLAAAILAVSWYWRHRERASFWGYLIFYLILSIGAQCKGLTAMIVPGLAVLADIIGARRWRTHFNLAHCVAIAIGAGVYLLPFLLAPADPHSNAPTGAHVGLWLVLRENIIRYVAPFDHTGPVYTYLIAIPRHLLPWSMAFVFALVAGFRNRWHEANQARWVLAVFVLIFAFFTLSGSRRHYYILPILPYCALMTAVYLQTARSRIALQITAALLTGAGVLQLSLLGFFPHLNHALNGALPIEVKWSSAGIGALLLLAMALIYRCWRERRDALMASCIAGAVILLGGFFFKHQLTIDRFRTEADFARQLAPIVAQHPDLQIVTFKDRPAAKLLFYADLPPTIRVAESATELQQLIANTEQPTLVLSYREFDSRLPAEITAQTPLLAEHEFAWEKNNKDKMRTWLIRK